MFPFARSPVGPPHGGSRHRTSSETCSSQILGSEAVAQELGVFGEFATVAHFPGDLYVPSSRYCQSQYQGHRAGKLIDV